MTGIKRITAAWLTILMLCLCVAVGMSARSESIEGLTVYSALDEISRHGNVYLVTEIGRAHV